jgi:hypothetical protein
MPSSMPVSAAVGRAGRHPPRIDREGRAPSGPARTHDGVLDNSRCKCRCRFAYVRTSVRIATSSCHRAVASSTGRSGSFSAFDIRSGERSASHLHAKAPLAFLLPSAARSRACPAPCSASYGLPIKVQILAPLVWCCAFAASSNASVSQRPELSTGRNIGRSPLRANAGVFCCAKSGCEP